MTTPLPSDPLLERLRQATLGLYEIRDELGRGGMAVVYMAKDLRLQRPVAIKVMMPALLHAEGMTDRFLQEARIAAQLQHPNIIIVHDVQQQDDLLYFVMNLVEGATIDELMRAAPLSIPQVRWILSSAARGLAHAHSEGVVHRDVKPGNLLVNVKGDVIVTDFGIAKGADSVRMTQTGMAIGTPVYMSPEQVTGATGLTAASDQYSLGVAAYEMIAGAPPFTGDSAFALQVAHVQKEPTDLMSKRSDCPPDLAFIVHRMLAKAPEQRWASLDEVSALAAAALPFGGGEARQQLAATARTLHERRGLSTAAFGIRTPRSPLPRPSVGRERTSGSVTALVLSPPETQLYPSGTVRLHSLAVVNGQDSGEHRAQWISTDPRVAVVTDEGEVLAIAAGRAEIIAVNQFGEARAAVEVVNAPVVNTPVPVVNTPVPVANPPVPVANTPVPVIRTMSVTLTPEHAAMEGGDALPLSVKVRDTTGRIVASPVIEWHSDAPKVAWVDDRGTVAALAAGRATISATVDGVTARTAIEVGSTWKTQNSLEQLVVPRPAPLSAPTPVPVSAPTPVPVRASTPVPVPTSAPVPVPLPTRVPESAPAPKPTSAPSKSRPGVLIGGGVALVALIAAVWTFMAPGDTTQSAVVDDAAGAVIRGGLTPPAPTPDSAVTPVAPEPPPMVPPTPAKTPAPETRDAVKGTAPRSTTEPPARVPARDNQPTTRTAPVTPTRQPTASVSDSVARPPAPAPVTAPTQTPVTEKTVAPPTLPAATPTAPPEPTRTPTTASAPPSNDAAVAAAVRDLSAQLQRKAVLVGPLKSFFQLGSEHTASIVGAPLVIGSATGGDLTASVSVEVKRTGPGGNIERRRTQVTFHVVGTGANATAQAISASNLQKP